jgi:hypothetical protein
VAKMLRQQKTVSFVNFSAFFNALSHNPELHVQHSKPLLPRLQQNKFFSKGMTSDV